MTTTLYAPAPITSITSNGYTITQAGTAVPDNLVSAIISAAYQADGVLLTTSAGGTTLVQVPSYYNPGTGAPSGDSLPVGAEVKDSAGAVFEKKSDGTWVSAVVLHDGVPVTDRAWNNMGNLSGGSNQTRTERVYYTVSADCSDLVLWFGGYYNDETAAIPNTFTIKAVIESAPSGPSSSAGTFYPLTFSGAATVTISNGQLVSTDPLPLDLAKGQGFYVRALVSVGTLGQKWPMGRQLNPNLGESTVNDTDTTTTGGTWNAGTGSGFSFGPVAITGRASVPPPTVGVVGSSTFQGRADIQDASTPAGGYYEWGWVRRLSNGNFGIVAAAVSGETGSAFTVGTYRGRGPLLSRCRYILEGYGANDITNGRTFGQVAADKLRLWQSFTRRGQKVYTVTLHPTLTTSTDSFATTGNQTPAATNAVRVAVNDWIRAGAPVDSGGNPVTAGTGGATRSPALVGYLEVADVVETSRGSGVYKAPGYTTDGQHMTSTAAAAVVAAVNAAGSPFV